MTPRSELERVECGKFLEVCNVGYLSNDNHQLTAAGNFYTIANDYDTPARIFFSQGCEVIEELPGSQGSQ